MTIVAISSTSSLRRIFYGRIGCGRAGVKKTGAQPSYWIKDTAPGPDLCAWLDHKLQRFVTFRRLYEYKLAGSPALG
jgi:uncharacterized protein YeaO (DUF488 family)